MNGLRECERRKVEKKLTFAPLPLKDTLDPEASAPTCSYSRMS